MTDREKPEVHLQITSGILRLSTDDAVYYISAPAAPDPRRIPERMEAPPPEVLSGASSTPMVTIDPDLSETPLPKESQPSAAFIKAEKENRYYLALVRKYHQSLGLLARQTASGLGRTVTDNGRKDSGVKEVGSDLERLEELISGGRKIKDLLASCSDLKSMTEEEKNSLAEEIKKAAAPTADFGPLLGKCRKFDEFSLSLLNRLTEALQQPVPAPAAPPPPSKKEIKTVKRLFFPLNDLFQIIYELAIGEEVKKAIKVVWDSIADFDEAQVNDTLSPISESFEIDDGFVLVPLEPLFKSLFTASKKEAFRSTIKKLNANRQKLFLDQSLPVEERYKEVQEEVETASPEQPPQEAPPPAVDFSGLKAEVEGFKEKLTAHLEELKNFGADPGKKQEASPALAQLLSATIIPDNGSAELLTELKSSGNLMAEQISGLEEIEKTLRSLAEEPPASSPGPSPDSGLMLQLLNILVEFDTRQSLTAQYLESGEDGIEREVARKINELKNKLGLGSDAAQDGGEVELDQKILNFLLSDMGF